MRPKLSPRARALALFSLRPRSRWEIKQKLLQLGEVNFEAILTDFTSAGLLDDLRFARWFVESRTHARPRSPMHLRLELKQKGVSPAIIDEVLADPQLEQTALATLIAQKASLPYPKLLSFLLRRGFKYPLIQAKLDELGIKG